MKILVHRNDCHGDVVAATSVLPGLSEKYPGAEIHFLVSSRFKPVLMNNPHIAKIIHQEEGPYDLKIPYLDHHMQWNTFMPAVHCRIAEVPFNPPEYYTSAAELEWAEQYRDCIPVANNAGWKSRQYNQMKKVVSALKQNYRFVQIDRGKELGVEAPQTTIRQAGAIIAVSELYLGIDTVFMHIASALEKPMALVMGPTSHIDGHYSQYVPTATVLRPRPPTYLEDPQYAKGIDMDPQVVIDAIKELYYAY